MAKQYIKFDRASLVSKLQKMVVHAEDKETVSRIENILQTAENRGGCLFDAWFAKAQLKSKVLRENGERQKDLYLFAFECVDEAEEEYPYIAKQDVLDILDAVKKKEESGKISDWHKEARKLIGKK